MDRLSIEGAWHHRPTVHTDSRGSLAETFRAAGLPQRLDVAQVNCSVSNAGVLRGVHFAAVPPGQAKYLMCVSGRILDVVVDVRVGSPTYGRWEAVTLEEGTRGALLIAEGLGHAFMALSEQATVIYLCSQPYAPGREHGVHPLDPAIGIDWPAGLEPVLSDKDAKAPTLEEARVAGLLPDYETCKEFYATLH
ncbi:dTDP-4-dehydrorhamnose 3,5-epimerase family protein [Nonomuraea jiangxiensis]|uniref:dTDP-4-dehydrorhamnose 3,5-epimerase n=1 Tax=Nonomuraea jiangxiensis TaxID=633440 RepID=A0A1G8MGS0_9ACTN|nr:dTDP-4-dehydrorhamnose 3,5-epimerase [Nonomuraea jiangxiensis]SDI67025.1 dTDP-4-dehydrorhamnose 3,5-epimerase [Nonomuraea jiangxiensis]